MTFYQIGFFVLAGFSGGLYVGMRFGPPTEEIEIKLRRLTQKLRGKGNVISDGITVEDLIDVVDRKPSKEEKKANRIAKRLANRLERKNKRDARKNSNISGN